MIKGWLTALYFCYLLKETIEMEDIRNQLRNKISQLINAPSEFEVLKPDIQSQINAYMNAVIQVYKLNSSVDLNTILLPDQLSDQFDALYQMVRTYFLSDVNDGKYGPGPQRLLYGNEELGYFGRFNSDDFLHSLDIVDQLNLTSLGVFKSDPFDWFKVIYKGKVLFIHSSIAGHGTTTGGTTNGAGYPWHSTNQIGTDGVREVVFNDHRFKCRTLSSRGDQGLSLIDGHNNVLDPIYTHGSEWNDIIYKFCETIPGSQKNGNWEDLSLFELLEDTTCSSEVSVWGRQVVRGHLDISGYASWMQSNHFQYGWKPVLEWVPE